MKILFNENLNFNARFLSGANVRRFNSKNQDQTYPVGVSIVEIKPECDKDVSAVRRTIKRWEKRDEYGHVIYQDLKSIRDGIFPKEKNKVFALTLQKDDFKNIDSKQILALAEIYKEKRKSINIDFLQVDPEFKYSLSRNKYKNIGKAFIEYFKAKFKDRIITLKSTYKAANFYEKMGFEVIDTDRLVYMIKPLITSIKK